MFSFIRYCLRRIRGFQAEAFGIFRTDLSSLMVLGESCQTLDEKISWLESLLDWIRIPLAPDQNSNIAHIEIIRVKFLLQALERSPHWKKTITKNIASILLETEPASLFCETGLNTEDGFFSEASERILKKIIPTPKNEKDLSLHIIQHNLFDNFRTGCCYIAVIKFPCKNYLYQS